MNEPIRIQIFLSLLPDLNLFLQMIVADNHELRSRPVTKRRATMDGLPLSFVFDSAMAYIYWVEFANDTEAALFKLKYL